MKVTMVNNGLSALFYLLGSLIAAGALYILVIAVTSGPVLDLVLAAQLSALALLFFTVAVLLDYLHSIALSLLEISEDMEVELIDMTDQLS